MFDSPMTTNKLAKNIIYLGLSGCLTCNFIGPVIKKSNEMNLFGNLDYKNFQTKSDYHNTALNLLKKFEIEIMNPIPIPLIFITIGSITSIASQTIMEEVAVKIQDDLSDTDLFAFFDEEINDNNLILSLISKIISDTMY